MTPVYTQRIAPNLHDAALTEMVLKISDTVSRHNFLLAMNRERRSAALYSCPRQVRMFGSVVEKEFAAEASFYSPTLNSGAMEPCVDNDKKDFFADHVIIGSKCRDVRMKSTTLIYALIDLDRIYKD